MTRRFAVSDDIVIRLRHVPFAQDWETTNYMAADAADEIERLRVENIELAALVSEFFPLVLREMKQGLAVGEADHDTCGCKDCTLYEWSLDVQRRLSAGEFDSFVIK